jgi:hypothetical protein
LSESEEEGKKPAEDPLTIGWSDDEYFFQINVGNLENAS